MEEKTQQPQPIQPQITDEERAQQILKSFNYTPTGSASGKGWYARLQDNLKAGEAKKADVMRQIGIGGGSPDFSSAEFPEGIRNVPSYLDKVKEDLAKRKQNISDISADQMANESAGIQTPEQTDISIRRQTTGQVFGGVTDIVKEAIAPILEPIFKGIIKPTVEGIIPDEENQHPMAKAIRDVGDQYKAAFELVQKKIESDPVFERKMKDLGSLGNIGMAILDAMGIAPLAKPVIKAGVEGVKTGIKETGGAFMKGAEGVQKAVEGIRKPLNVIEDIATPIPENVKKVLSNPERAPEVKTKLEGYFSQGRKAIEKTGENTPLEIAGKTRLEEAMNSLNEGLKKAGESKRASLAESGSKSGDISSIKTSFEQGLSERLGTKIDEFGNLVDAEGRKSVISSSPSDTKMVNLVRSKLDSLEDMPTLQKINDVVDSLQAELYKTPMKGAEAINSSTQGFVKSITRDLNEIAKELGGDTYKTANQNYARLIELKENLNSKVGDNYKNAGSIMKRVFSPTDAGIKDLIRALETETGIPIFEDAVLAKFVMDTLGDQRAMSLLDKGALSSKGWLNKMIDFGLSRVQNPEGKAIRMVEKQIK